MPLSRFTLFACTAAVGFAALAASVPSSPAAARGLDLSWLSNDGYVRCLKYVSALANGDEAAYDRGRRACNRQYFPNKPGVQY